jgi:hypothetical protein
MVVENLPPAAYERGRLKAGGAQCPAGGAFRFKAKARAEVAAASVSD